MKRSPIKQRRDTPRRREAPQWDADAWQAADWQLTTRAHGNCERCGKPLHRDHTSRHHRQRRRDGGDRLANLLLLCGSGTTGCHGWVHANPQAATEQGWIVPTWANPANIPVRLADGYLWVLRDDGTKTPCP